MLKQASNIATEAKWKASDINGRQISVMIDSSRIPATLGITYEGEIPTKEDKKLLLRRQIAVILEKQPTGHIRLEVPPRGPARVHPDYYLTQNDWNTLVNSDFATPISPGE